MASCFVAGIWYHPIIDEMSRNDTFTNLVVEVSLLAIVLPINSEFRQVQGYLKQSTFHEKKIPGRFGKPQDQDLTFPHLN